VLKSAPAIPLLVLEAPVTRWAGFVVRRRLLDALLAEVWAPDKERALENGGVMRRMEHPPYFVALLCNLAAASVHPTDRPTKRHAGRRVAHVRCNISFRPRLVEFRNGVGGLRMFT
jgi:hypothetical protein